MILCLCSRFVFWYETKFDFWKIRIVALTPVLWPNNYFDIGGLAMPVRKQGKLCWISYGILISHGYILFVQSYDSNNRAIIVLNVKLQWKCDGIFQMKLYLRWKMLEICFKYFIAMVIIKKNYDILSNILSK